MSKNFGNKIQKYGNRRLETEEELRTLIKVYEEHKERKSKALPSSWHDTMGIRDIVK